MFLLCLFCFVFVNLSCMFLWCIFLLFYFFFFLFFHFLSFAEVFKSIVMQSEINRMSNTFNPGQDRRFVGTFLGPAFLTSSEFSSRRQKSPLAGTELICQISFTIPFIVM